jgi:hypothetical protein
MSLPMPIASVGLVQHRLAGTANRMMFSLPEARLGPVLNFVRRCSLTPVCWEGET